MAKRFHQQSFLPFVPNPFSFVEVTESDVRWQHGINERFRLPLESVRASHDPKGGIWAQVLGAGDVVVTDVTDHRVPNVLRGRALRACIGEQRATVERQARVAREAQEMRDRMTEFEEHAICFPPIPGGVFFVLRHTVGAVCAFTHAVKQNALVLPGDVLGYYRDGMHGSTCGIRFDLVAPFAGRVVFQGYKDFAEQWDTDRHWPMFHPNPGSNVLLAIQPAAGQDTSNAIGRAYAEIVARVRRSISERDFGGAAVEPGVNLEVEISNALGRLTDAKERKTGLPIEETWKDQGDSEFRIKPITQ